MPGAVESTGDMPCRVCREPIRPGAKKCLHCGSYQNWWAQLLASGPALSLLVALVAVTTPWIPVAKELLAPKGAEIRTAFGGVFGNSLAVNVTNVGTMPASVQQVNLTIGDEKAITVYPLQIQNSSRLVEPGKTVTVRGALMSGATAPSFSDPPQKCALETWFTDDLSQLKAHRDGFACFLAIPVIVIKAPGL